MVASWPASLRGRSGATPAQDVDMPVMLSTRPSWLLLLLVTLPCCTGSDGGEGNTSTTTTGTSSGESTPGLPPVGTTSSATDGSTTSADTSGAPTVDGSSGEPETGSSGEPDDPEPALPPGLTVYVTGDPADADIEPTGPGLILMGGGPEVDEAYRWWGDYVAGGDVVVIRTSGSDGYNQYLYDFGNVDSVETMLVTAEHANAPYVHWKLRHAEAIWMAGGDQATYLEGWMGTRVEDGIKQAWERGAVVGGTSAGLAVLGEFMFAAYNGTVYSDEALEDPYNEYMTLERDFLELMPMAGVLTDSHFAERDRMGRLVGMLARLHADGWSRDVTGIGIDETTAVVAGPDGQGMVLGDGNVYVVRAAHPAEVCAAGMPLEYSGLGYHTLSAGDTIAFPGARVTVPSMPLAASGGVTIPASPY